MTNLKTNPMYRYLMVLVITSTAGLQGWIALYTNFAKEVVGVNGFQMGISQAVREIPGFLTFLVIYVLLFMKEHRLSAWSVLLMGIGIGLTGFFTSFGGMLFTTILMSTGFHYFETTNKSLTIQHFDKSEAPYVFAKLRGYGALANIAVGAMIWGLSFVFPYKINFLILGIFVALAGLFMLIWNPKQNENKKQQSKLQLKKKYWLFYVLNFLGGARRQIYIVFAIFLLVEKYKLAVTTIVGVYVVSYALTFLFNRFISKAIHTFGERAVLMLESGSLVILFLGYAFIQNVYVILGLFLLDSVFMNFAIALNTYLQKTADPKDLASTTAVGFTINHVTAIIIPCFGGAMWLLDRRFPFILGAVITCISLFFTTLIRTPEKNGQVSN